MDWPDLPELFPEFPDAGRWLPLLRGHWSFIEAHRSRVRVTAVQGDATVRRNYAECLELWRIASAGEAIARTVDVGSGGGFPGIVIAAVAPSVEVHLVEPLGKRARFLEAAATELGLSNVTVHPQRAEDAGRGSLRETADLVVARAVANLRELLEYTSPFARPGGRLALARGSGLDAELGEAADACARLACSVEVRAPMRPVVSDTPWVLLLRKLGPLDARYPRRAGLPAKRPL